MLEWILVISLILIGISFIIIEVILIPGTTFVGIAGVIFIGCGIYLGFINFGNTLGYVLIGITALLSMLSFYLSFKARLWERFSLKSVNDKRINEISGLHIKEGDLGKAVSNLRPSGTGEFGTTLCEVRSMGGFVLSGTEIKIIRIEPNKIFVEPIN